MLNKNDDARKDDDIDYVSLLSSESSRFCTTDILRVILLIFSCIALGLMMYFF